MTKKISTKDISELRARTGAGIGDCKAALEEAGGDLERANDLLRQKGIAKGEKRAGRSASEGLIVIATAPDGRDAAMIDLNCETDFVARTDEFGALARDLAAHALAHADTGINAGAFAQSAFRGKPVAEVITETSGKIGEAMSLTRYARFTQPKGIVGSYLHHNGQVGVLVEVQGADGDALRALATDVALHVASADPVAVNESDIPADVVERERRIAEEQVTAEGKPEKIRGKIVDGKIRKFLAERALLSQNFVKDESKTVGDLVTEAAKTLGGAVRVVRFARFKVGEVG